MLTVLTAVPFRYLIFLLLAVEEEPNDTNKENVCGFFNLVVIAPPPPDYLIKIIKTKNGYIEQFNPSYTFKMWKTFGIFIA